MGGKFQLSREIFEHGIWNNVSEFRLFVYLIGKAMHSEGVMVGNIKLKKGQYIRSYRKLREDLKYIENNTIKHYGLGTIKRLVDKLVTDGRITILETELGTLFTVTNYSNYQGFENNKKGTKNTNETPTEHQRNNNKNDMNDKKEHCSKISEKFHEETIEYKLSNLLYERMLENDSNTKKPNLHKWAEHIDKLIRLDGRSVEDIRRIIDFSTDDDFWKTNILSTSKLRKQFPTLYLREKDTNNHKVLDKPSNWRGSDKRL